MIEQSPAEKYFGLTARPFSLTPDLRFAYHSRSHTHALEQVTSALRRREWLIVVTGAIGTGKTMLCRTLLETFESRTFLSLVLDPGLDVADLLRKVLTDFGIINSVDGAATGPLSDVTRHQYVTALQQFLASLIPLQAHAVIMIDEAQHLTGPVLEQVRLLSNFETDSAKLLQIVLVGQPNLDLVLQRPDMRQLNQRVARRFELQPLSEAEVSDYIERRLLVASENPDRGAARDLDLSNSEPMVRFAPAASKMVAAISKGIPRLVNTLCDRSLDIAFEAQSHIVERKAVLEAAERLRLPAPAGGGLGGIPLRHRVAAAAALVAILAGGAWWWVQRQPAAVAPVSAAPPATPAPSAPSDAVAPPAVNAPAPASTTGALPPPPSAAPAPTVDGAAPRFELTAASFRTEERAAAVTASLARTGLPTATRLDATGEWYRVVVGPFATRQEALNAQEALDAQGFRGSRIYTR